jgi:uncharacterized protein YndB with AHSA1/START domain
MTTDIKGEMRLDGDRPAVRLEQTYRAGVADLWSAVTEPARLVRWFEVVFDENDATQQASGRILECEEPSHLRVSWLFGDQVETVLTLDLHPTTDGARLVLDHERLPVGSAAGLGAGWETYLEQLGAMLAGGDAHGSSWDERWHQLEPLYRSELHRLVGHQAPSDEKGTRGGAGVAGQPDDGTGRE